MRISSVVATMFLVACGSGPSSDTATPDGASSDGAEATGAIPIPADGRVYHGSSPTFESVDAYAAALGGDRAPLFEGMHAGIPGTRPDMLVDTTRSFLEHVRASGRVPHLSYSISAGDGVAMDHEVAETAMYDQLIDDVAAAIRDYADPVFVRIGFEFNGSWNAYTPGVYVTAFRKIVDRFRAAGVSNASYIWCYEPDADGEFDAVDSGGQPLWYPGDAYVDWFGLDVFHHTHFDAATPDLSSGQETPHGRASRFLAMARDHDRPVYLSETAAVDAHLTADLTDGQADWSSWYQSFFDWIAAHPEIKGFNYMDQNYLGTHYDIELGWGDARIETNEYVLDHYRQAIADPRFVHAGEGLAAN